MTRITLDYLESLSAPKTFISGTERRTLSSFADEQLPDVLSRIKEDALGQHLIEPIDLGDQIAQLGLSHDTDLIELCALGAMNSRNRGPDGFFSPRQMTIRRAIASRVHALIESRPELLHSNLMVPKNGVVDGDVGMLRFLVEHSVAFEPERLQNQARRPGPAGDVLQRAIQQGKSHVTTLLEEALSTKRGCASTATALVLADIRAPELDDYQVQQLWTMCAFGVAGEQWQLSSVMQLLHAIRQRQDEAGGDGHRFTWSQGRELLDSVNFSWASARGAHPTLGLVYETALRSAYIGDLRNSDVTGFPGDPLEAVAAALNAVLEPEVRLELAELSSQNLVRLTVLCPRVSNGVAVQNFWRRDPAGWNANNPSDLLNWAVTRSDESEEPLDLEFLNSQEKDLSEVLGPAHFNALRAQVTDQVMSRAIVAASAHDEAIEAAPAARRRARMV